MDETRARIMEAAESLFVERGFGQTSLRAITSRASVNLAAVNYHFGSKDGLIRELASQRLKPVNAERMRRLNALRRRGTPTLEAVLVAFVEPLLCSDRPDAGNHVGFLRLLGSAQPGMSEPLRTFIGALDRHVVDTYERALAEVLPELPRTELHWRIGFLNGLVSYLLGRAVADAPGGQASDTHEPRAVLLQHLMPFVVAGFRAPGGAPERAQGAAR